jgi:type II secretory pathway component PulF
VALVRLWARTDNGAGDFLDQVKLRLPVVGDVWIKYQVAQLARGC